MCNTLNIDYSRDYDSFKFFDENRPVQQRHVDALVKDLTFPSKFKTSPIVVDSKMGIVDGQHRFHAAKKLDIGIWFILDPDAGSDDIRRRNKGQIRWTSQDYLHFYSKSSADYKRMLDLKEQHKIPLPILFSAVKLLGGYGYAEFSENFKDGLIRVWFIEKILTEFLDSYIPYIKNCRLVHGEIETSPLFSDAYSTAACRLFRDEKESYDKIMKYLIKWPHAFPIYRSGDEAKEFLKKLPNGKYQKKYK